jgi:Glycosyltransferase family 87
MFSQTIRIVLGLLLVTLVASIAKYFGGTNDVGYTHYNNYIIFIQSFRHLLDNTNLYVLYPQEHWDLYKYSPTFALAMAPFAALPDWLGFPLFSLLNTGALCWAILRLPDFDDRTRSFLLLFIALELITSIQNAQTNAWIAALLIGAFNAMERRQVWLATLCLVLSVYIKVLGIVGFALFLLYPDKGRFILSSIVWTLALALLPLVVCTPSELIQQYQNWGVLLAEDHSISYGLSVMGWWQRWFGWEGSKTAVVLGGAVLFCLPFLRWGRFEERYFRLLFLSSILLWVVIFNHRAESPSFIIAICGIGIWYWSRPRPTADFWWMVGAFVLTSVCTTDLVPRWFRMEIFHPYHLKALPAIFIWVKVWWIMINDE